MQYTTAELIIVTSTILYIIIIVLVIVFALRKIQSLRRRLAQQFPEQSINAIKELLQRMAGQLTDGDFKALIQQANNIPEIKMIGGEFGYMYRINKVIFTRYEEPISQSL